MTHLYAVFSSLLVVLLCFTTAQAYSGTPLDDYIHLPDPVFAWQVVASQRNDAAKYTIYSILMISQQYQDASYSNRSIWEHNVEICVPDTIYYPNLAFLALGAGDNTLGLPTDVVPFVVGACQSGIFSVGVGQIPNEPITFNNHGTPVTATEDDAIAYTWRSFMNDSDAYPFQILQFAMVKAAVKAMDVTQAFGLAHTPNAINIQSFVVAGASKRGWATWLTAAADERVQAIVPIVIPLLNMANNVPNIYPSLGQWGFAIEPYTDQHVFDFKGFPEFDILMRDVDPLFYNARYANMKKLIIDSTLDQFFLLDGPKYFWNALAGPKWLALLPNGDHSLATVTADLGAVLIAFLHSVGQNVALPTYSWSLQYSNTTAIPASVTLTTSSGSILADAKLWTCTTHPGARDFRATVCADTTNPACFSGLSWSSTPIALPTPRTPTVSLRATLPSQVIAPTVAQQQWTGFFIQATFTLTIFGAVPINITLTSEANIFPDFYPFPAFQPNYASIGKDITCLKSLNSFQTKTSSWTTNGVQYSQWLVTITSTKPLYALNVNLDIPAGAQVSNYWGITPRGYIYEIADWRLESGQQVAPGSPLTFGYQISSALPANITFPGVSCVPPPRNCSVSLSQSFVSSWVSGAYTFRQYTLDITNYGTYPTDSGLTLAFSTGSTISSAWNLTPTATSPTTYSAPVWGLPAGSSSVSSGYILQSPTSSPFTTPVPKLVSQACSQ